MCFSPAASFTASAALGVVGLGTLTKITDKRELWLASMPLLFALQQGIEGFVWLTLLGDGAYTLALSTLFLLIASFWWPIHAPLGAYMLEVVPWRKKIIGLLLAGGILVGIVQLISILRQPVAAQIINKCIYYHFDVPFPTLMVVLYGLATVGAGLVSSKRIINLFAALVGIFAYISWRVYTVNFASVWCFFAAALSFILYFYFFSRKTSRV